MILRSSLLIVGSYILGNGALSAKAGTPFDCHITLGNNLKFDLTTIAGEQVVNKTRNTEPTLMVDSLKFNLCSDLTIQSDIPESDQCPPGTRACYTQVNKKAEESDRVISVIPMAVTNKMDDYIANFEPTSLHGSLSLVLQGTDYPTTDPKPQSLNLTLICNQQSNSEPEFLHYDGSKLDVEWSTSAGCPLKEEGNDTGGDKDKDKEDDKKDDPAEEHVGSGIGWFFLVLLLSLTAYFGLGAYYNYSTYGATGYDLIPHRDFWKEVPYMLSDVVSHLCSTVHPRRTSSRGGYISV